MGCATEWAELLENSMSTPVERWGPPSSADQRSIALFAHVFYTDPIVVLGEEMIYWAQQSNFQIRFSIRNAGIKLMRVLTESSTWRS